MDEHLENFLAAIRDRSPTTATPQIAHGSCALVHLGKSPSELVGDSILIRRPSVL